MVVGYIANDAILACRTRIVLSLLSFIGLMELLNILTVNVLASV